MGIQLKKHETAEAERKTGN